MRNFLTNKIIKLFRPATDVSWIIKNSNENESKSNKILSMVVHIAQCITEEKIPICLHTRYTLCETSYLIRLTFVC